MVRKRSLTALGVAVFVVFVFASVGQVWAYTITPNPPIAEQPFTIAANSATDTVRVGLGCTGSGNILEQFDSGTGSVTLRLSASQYGFEIDGETDCALFTVEPASIPEYPNPTYGLPILAILMILAYAVIKRRTRI